MTALEIFMLIVYGLLIGNVFVRAYRSKDKRDFWNPLTLVSAVFGYYFLFGPLLLLAIHNTTYVGLEMRDLMWKGWLAGLLSLATINLGYYLKLPPIRTRLVATLTPKTGRKLLVACLIVYSLGLVGFAYDLYVSGRSLMALFMPFHANVGADSLESGHEGFAAGNYLWLLINSFIPAMCLAVVLVRALPWKRQLLWLGIPAVQAMMFFISIGFRQRIVILLLSMAAAYCLEKRLRPKPIWVAVAGLGLVLMSGAIGLTRSYGKGLDLSVLSTLSFWDVVMGGIAESGTFFTLSMVVDSIPRLIPHVGLDPLWTALTIPIPRAIWWGKPYSAIFEQFEILTGTKGQAVPIMGEHYMMAGWIGIIVGGIIWGIIFRRFWEFYKANPNNPLVTAFYAVAWALVFTTINRGYLSQTLMEYFFDLVPLGIIYLILKKGMLAVRRKKRGGSETADAVLTDTATTSALVK